MTREEAIEYLNTLYMALAVFPNQQISLGDVDKMKESVSMAISALSQEPSGDLISRQAVLDVFWKLDVELRPNAIDAILNMVNDIPSVKQEPKTGHWIEDTNGTYTDNHDTWECSECGNAQILLEGTPKDNDYNYCPNCGAKMVEQEGSEEC